MTSYFKMAAVMSARYCSSVCWLPASPPSTWLQFL